MGDYSIYTGVKKTFSIVDYGCFGATLAVSIAIGIYYAIKDNQSTSTKNYLLGGRQMSIVPVSLSILVTSFSATTLLGMPAEVYSYNTMIWWMCLSASIGLVIAATVFVPFFYNLNVTSIYEYLGMRFGRCLRVLASILFLIKALTYMAFVLYVPSLALNAATDFSLWGSVISVGIVVTFYTAIGGMKAVLWTDTFQALVIMGGLTAALVQGLRVVGGLEAAWMVAEERSRIYFTDFHPDPSTRHSFWGLVLGGSILWLNLSTGQAQIQRASSCSSVTRAKLAMLMSAPFLAAIMSVCCLLGVTMFAFYKDCHPLKFNSLISRSDQILPLYIMDILGHLPGLPGIFISCLFSGSLSTLSSALTAIGAVVPRDLIQPFCCKNISDKMLTVLSKVIVVLSGIATIAFAFLVSQLGGILQATYTVASITSGPLFGLFILGMFFPRANKWGALVGSLTSLGVMCWIGMGAFLTRASYVPPSPFITSGCNWNVTQSTIFDTSPATIDSTSQLPMNATRDVMNDTSTESAVISIFKMSYMWYLPTALLIEIVVGLLVSVLTGCTKPEDLKPELICPIFDRLCPFLPESWRQRLRFHKNTERSKKSKASTEMNRHHMDDSLTSFLHDTVAFPSNDHIPHTL
ncbi:sodium-dependent multivitamin transporter-like [Haliotis rufescens]|uniref:sodium-dependent multivitamin transporter-like n=1 Tax=Haliotis rufescens TaxID=6454 RepID=UPI001EB07F4F|nr:sodium-dependent multivitamin transporter-like [Haliotis rufescens]